MFILDRNRKYGFFLKRKCHFSDVSLDTRTYIKVTFKAVLYSSQEILILRLQHYESSLIISAVFLYMNTHIALVLTYLGTDRYIL